MGYQESYVYIKNEKKFDELVKLVIKQTTKWKDEWYIEASGIVTLDASYTGTLDYTCAPDEKYAFEKVKS